MLRRGTRDDFDGAVALAGANPDLLRWHWDVPSFDPARHLWVAERNGGLAAFGALYAPDQAAVRGDAELVVPLLARIEEQAREEGIAQLTFVIPDWDEPAWRAYENSGFELVTEVLQMEVVLDGPQPEPHVPDGITIRTYTGDDATAVHALLDEAYLGWDDSYVPMAHADWLAFMTSDASFDPECWFLAEENGTLVGACLCWTGGWVKDVAVAEGGRGRGLGEALVRHAFARLSARGVRTMGLKVDARNPTSAIRLYERLGMQVVKRFRVYLKRL
jgi:ribosomal protein S18 acetylase RimI-like enzyme